MYKLTSNIKIKHIDLGDRKIIAVQDSFGHKLIVDESKTLYDRLVDFEDGNIEIEQLTNKYFWGRDKSHIKTDLFLSSMADELNGYKYTSPVAMARGNIKDIADGFTDGVKLFNFCTGNMLADINYRLNDYLRINIDTTGATRAAYISTCLFDEVGNTVLLYNIDYDVNEFDDDIIISLSVDELALKC